MYTNSSVNNICYCCQMQIIPNDTFYKGHDHTFCSLRCRVNVIGNLDIPYNFTSLTTSQTQINLDNLPKLS